MITWHDGLQVCPDGDFVRQVVHKSMRWESTTWITETGTAYQRSWNPWKKEWEWSKARMGNVDCQRKTAMVMGVGTGSDRREMRVSHAIALAYVPLPLGTPKCDTIEDKEAYANNLRWRGGKVEVVKSGEEEEVEEWRPLRCVWFRSTGEVAFEYLSEAAYLISNKGRITSRLGGETSGERAYGGRRWCSVSEHGAFWIDAAVLASFGEGAHFAEVLHVDGDADNNRLENLRWGEPCSVKPPLLRTIAAVKKGKTAAGAVRELGVMENTAWNYFARAAAELPRDMLAPLHKLLPSELLEKMRALGNLYGENCIEKLHRRLHAPYHEVVLARELLAREAWTS